jgi:hypothetical protein
MATRKINISYEPKPIPMRNFDYCATFDGYEPGDPIGYGATEEAAKAELLESADMDATT